MADQQEINDQLQDLAERGDIKMLYSLLRENPKLFDSMDKERFVNTPLHVAASSHHHEGSGSPHDQEVGSAVKMAEFAAEMAIIMPSFTRKLNTDGLTPLHLALLHKNWKTARALVTLDPELIRVKGTGGKTPLHVAAEVASPQLLAELLFICPSSMEDTTAQWKTVVHIALEAERFESFQVLLGWLLRMDKRNLLYSRDMDGNNVLHLAVLTSQTQVVEMLTPHMTSDIKNFKGETALTILGKNSGPPERREEIRRFLFWRNLLKPYDAEVPRDIFALGHYLGHTLPRGEVMVRGATEIFFGRGNQISREVVLVIAILVATATYQGVLSTGRILARRLERYKHYRQYY